jgi:hypothetical protein
MHQMVHFRTVCAIVCKRLKRKKTVNKLKAATDFEMRQKIRWFDRLMERWIEGEICEKASTGKWQDRGDRIWDMKCKIALILLYI